MPTVVKPKTSPVTKGFATQTPKPEVNKKEESKPIYRFNIGVMKGDSVSVTLWSGGGVSLQRRKQAVENDPKSWATYGEISIPATALQKLFALLPVLFVKTMLNAENAD